MSIKSITEAPTGLVSVNPSVIYINTTDTYATVTTAGYLTSAKQFGTVFNNLQMALVETSDDGPVWLQVSVTGTPPQTVSLIAPPGDGSVVLPTIANHIATYTNVTGTLSEDPATAISGGNIQAGLSGTAGTLASFPATAAKGSLVLKAVANTGNTLTTISNDAMGQASVVNIPDPANAVGQFVVGATATPFVSGNFPVNSGTAGLMVDSGVAATNLVSKIASNVFSGSGQITLAKANGTESGNAVTASGNAGVITTSSLTTAAGASYAITWTNTKITATSVLSFCIQGGTNTTQNITFECIPGTGTATLTIYNNTAATALNGTIFIGYMVM